MKKILLVCSMGIALAGNCQREEGLGGRREADPNAFLNQSYWAEKPGLEAPHTR